MLHCVCVCVCVYVCVCVRAVRACVWKVPVLPSFVLRTLICPTSNNQHGVCVCVFVCVRVNVCDTCVCMAVPHETATCEPAAARCETLGKNLETFQQMLPYLAFCLVR